MSDGTIEKYQSILSHIESLSMPEGEYLQLVNAIRDIRNKPNKDKGHQWKTLSHEVSFNFEKLLTSDYKSITIVIQEIKLTVPEHRDNYFSAKGFILYDFKEERHQFNVKNIKELFDSITSNYKPSQISYRYGFIRNIMNGYDMLANHLHHEEKCREMEILKEESDDDDDDDGFEEYYNSRNDAEYNKLQYMYSYIKSNTYNILRQFYFDGMEIM